MIRALPVALFPVALLAFACGEPRGGDDPPDAGEASRTVGGSISGLRGTVVLQNRGGDDLSITSNGAFVFATAIKGGDAYAVTVLTQPLGQTCTVVNGTGTISGADVTNVTVSCADSTDFWTIGERTFSEAASTSSRSGYDPLVTGRLHRTSFPPTASFVLGAGWSAADGDFSFSGNVYLYPGATTSLVATYALSLSDSTTGHAGLSLGEYTTAGEWVLDCSAREGTLTVTEDAGPGGRVRATYTVTAWEERSGAGTCPATPTSGTLSISREADGVYGNNGSQGDHFTIGPTTFTEGSTVLYDPLAEAYRHFDGIGYSLLIGLRAGGDPAVVQGVDHDLRMYLFLGSSQDTGGGTFTPPSGCTVTYQSGTSTTCFATHSGAATVTVGPFATVGSVFDGTLTVNAWSNATGSCPSTPWVVPFSATREADK